MPVTRFRIGLPGRKGARSARQTARPSAHLRSRVWSLGRLLVLIVALGATAGVFFLGAFRVASRAREVSVPDLAGLSLADAGSILADLGLSLRVDPLRRSESNVPADHVVWQEPEPGATTRRQRSVRVRLSDGQQAPEVPDVLGQQERTVEARLSQASIEIASRAEIRAQDYAAGSVVAVDPPAGGRASTVSLLVNRGERSSSYVMPDLIGTPGRQAIDALRARGFRATIVAELIYPGLPAGIVIRQTPQPGFQYTFGETIALEVSR